VFEVAMKDRESQAAISELAGQTGVQPRRPWLLRILRAVSKKGTTGKRRLSGLVMFAGEDAPRDLDDPLSDPKVQIRFGEAIAKQSKPRR